MKRHMEGMRSIDLRVFEVADHGVMGKIGMA